MFKWTKYHIELALSFGADLRDADLCGANMRSADLRDADLRGADLRDADLRGADLRRADLIRADLSNADLCGANLCDADLRYADLRDADLRGADLDGVNIDFASWPLWCGSLDVKNGPTAQLLYHALRSGSSLANTLSAIKEVRDIANTFHRVEDGSLPAITEPLECFTVDQ